MVADASPSGFRISLREALLAFAAASVGFAALVYANSWWLATVNTVALVAIVAAIIVAILGRGSGRAFAVGFCVALVAYLVAAFALKQNRPASERLLTNVALEWAFDYVAQARFHNWETKEVIREADLPEDARVMRLGQSISMPSSRPVFSRVVTPLKEHFLAVGNMLWALLLGAVGGCFARTIYGRSGNA